jgi:hypothetical protein
MKRGLILLGVIFGSLLPTAVQAQCGRSYTPTYTSTIVHHDPIIHEVITPIAVPVPIAVPAFQFQWAPPCGCGQQVPVQAGGYSTPGYGYGGGYGGGQTGYVQPPVQSPQMGYPPQSQAPLPVNGQDKIRELARALLEEMQRQSDGDDGPPVAPNGFSIQQPQEPIYRPALPPQQPYPPQQPQQPTHGFNNSSPSAPLAFAALQRTCSACHTGSSSRGGAVIFSQPNMLNPQAPWGAIREQIAIGRMPPRQSQWTLQPQETDAIAQTINP